MSTTYHGFLLTFPVLRQGPTALAVGAGGGCLDILLSSIFSLLGVVGWCDGAG